jgi:hypothetical protein
MDPRELLAQTPPSDQRELYPTVKTKSKQNPKEKAMKKRKSGYVKVSRNLFETSELYRLKKEERAEGIGVFMIMVMYMAKLENATGNNETLSVLSVLTGKKKWYVKHIINDYGLFTVEGESFQCRMLRKTFNVETFLGKDDTGLDAETNDGDATSASVENQCPSSNSSSNSFPELSSDSLSKLHNNVCPRAGASPIKDKKIKDKSSTGVLQKERTTTTTDFHDVVEHIFSLPGWLETVEKQMQIGIFSERRIRDFVRARFIEEIEMNGSYDDGEPFTESRAKRYFVNWIRPGKPPRHDLNLKLNAFLRGEDQKKTAPRDNRPFEGFGSIDSAGRRRGPHGEPVPMDAPPCMDIMMEWNGRTEAWE